MSKTNRIIFHYPHLKLWAGGTKFILTIAELIAKDNNVDFITNVTNKNITDKFAQSKINFIEISKLSTNSLVYWLFFPINFISDVFFTALHVQKNDILISCLFPSNAICALVAKIKKAKHYHYCFEPFPFLRNQSYINGHDPIKRLLLRFLSKAYSWLDDYGVKNTVKVFTLNQITAKMIKKTYHIPSVITLMGVDSEHFKPNNNDKFNQYKPYVVHSTDYTNAKNTDLAIKTIAQMKDKKIKLLITSTRPEAPEKEALIKMVEKLNLNDRVLFLDLVDYQDLPILYSNAICYLSCSYDEMLGTTSSNLPVKEALACETPAIRASITTEDVEDGKSGYLIDPRNTKLAAKKIEFLLKNISLKKKMGEIGRKKIVKLYKWDSVAKVILEEIS